MNATYKTINNYNQICQIVFENIEDFQRLSIPVEKYNSLITKYVPDESHQIDNSSIMNKKYENVTERIINNNLKNKNECINCPFCNLDNSIKILFEKRHDQLNKMNLDDCMNHIKICPNKILYENVLCNNVIKTSILLDTILNMMENNNLVCEEFKKLKSEKNEEKELMQRTKILEQNYENVIQERENMAQEHEKLRRQYNNLSKEHKKVKINYQKECEILKQENEEIKRKNRMINDKNIKQKKKYDEIKSCQEEYNDLEQKYQKKIQELKLLKDSHDNYNVQEFEKLKCEYEKLNNEHEKIINKYMNYKKKKQDELKNVYDSLIKNTHHSTTINNSLNNVNVLNYISTNCGNAQPIDIIDTKKIIENKYVIDYGKQLQFDDNKTWEGEDEANKNNKSKPKFIVEKMLINNYKLNKNNYQKYVGDFFVKFYKKEDLTLQPIWNTDITRYSYIIKTFSDNWIKDKNGIKLIDKSIKPFIEFIIESLSKYKKYIIQKKEKQDNNFFIKTKELCESNIKKKDIDKYDFTDFECCLEYNVRFQNYELNDCINKITDKFVTDLLNLHKLLSCLQDINFPQKVIKEISPHFAIDKNKMIK